MCIRDSTFTVALTDVFKLKGKAAETLMALQKEFCVKIQMPEMPAPGVGAPPEQQTEAVGTVRITGLHKSVEACLSSWRFKAPQVKITDVTLRKGEVPTDEKNIGLPSLAGRAKYLRDQDQESPFKDLAEWAGSKSNKTVGVGNQLLSRNLQAFVAGGANAASGSSSEQLSNTLKALTAQREKSRWGQLFARLDSNGDGVLSEPEMATLVGELLHLKEGKAADPLEVNKFAKEAISRMDKSMGLKSKNAVSFREFENYIEKVEPALFMQLGGWSDVFSRYSEGDSHQIGLEGMKKLVRDLWGLFPDTASEDEAELHHEAALAVSQMDLDGDGMVSFNELLSYAQQRKGLFEPLVACEHQRRTGQQYSAQLEALKADCVTAEDDTLFHRECTEMFARLDQDKDNYLTRPEIRQLVRQLLKSRRQAMSDEQVEGHVEHALKHIAFDPSLGKVTFKELYAYVQVRPALFYDLAGWQAVFSKYSSARGVMGIDGCTLLVRDLTAMLGNTLEAGEAQGQANACMIKMDQDGDGWISFDEFIEYAQHEDNMHLFGPLRLQTQKEYNEVRHRTKRHRVKR
eukprot:TRINITY_DN13978_c0_g1_i1.p1 TRINITY_DN13978_c0_g1~~TRINITY_DN13978_c0_g1_i1.p1  ORF type:complete len:573 (-),score=187.36 TRINITY_DN13978_c0_g1_i1:274-1992(-)